MYSMWVSLGRSRDPFLIVPGIPVNRKYRDSWSHRRIRREILQADNQTLNKVSCCFWKIQCIYIHIFVFRIPRHWSF